MADLYQLRGVQLPKPRFRTAPLPSELSSVQGYKHLQTFFPTLTKVFRLGRWNSGEEIWMGNRWKIHAIDCSGSTGPCVVKLSGFDASDNVITAKKAFLKATHLLDPIHWIRGEYTLPKENGLPWFHRPWSKAWQKLQDPGNQAYIDAVASYALGRLCEEDISPHFNAFFGAFCATADLYRYNLTDDFQTYRHERWFWKGHRRGLFRFKVVNMLEPDQPVSQDVMDDILQEYMDSDESESGDETGTATTAEELSELDVSEEDGSIHSDDGMDDVSFAEGSTTSDDDDDSHMIYAELEKYPVMLIITEQSEGTMDSIFEDTSLVGFAPGSADWETCWAAWMFQIIAALSCAQTIFGFTHNDLHTNNIVWSKTDKEFLFYTSRTGNIFKVPTYGKIFKIIDFGRAIFTINRQQFISDDFKAGNDAEGQYAFPPLVSHPEKLIPPNPSFDLCRLAVSMIDGIFPKKPATRAGGVVLSQEDGLTVYETESDLYNMIWSWMIDDTGANIFINPDGSERFPSFDLYKHIGEFIHNAIPSQQLFAKAFVQFQAEEGVVPTGVKKYSLFC